MAEAKIIAVPIKLFDLQMSEWPAVDIFRLGFPRCRGGSLACDLDL